MLGFSFRADLAGGERGLDPALMPPEVAADEHGLALLHPGLELHPGELVAAAGEIEEAVPVAVREAHDALGAQDVGGQAPEQALEHRLPERQPGAVDEAPDGVGVQVVGARTRALAEGRDAGREEHVAVERATHGLHALGARVQLGEPALEARHGGRVDQIELVHDQEVRRLDLRPRDLRLGELPLDVGRVDHGDDRIEPEARVLHAVGERLGVGEPGRLDDDEMRLRGVDDLLDRQVEAVVVDRAADAAARQLDHLLDVGEAGHHLAVDPDLADLVHDDGDRLPCEAVLEHVAQERRLPAAEEAGQDVDRDRAHLGACPGDHGGCGERSGGARRQPRCQMAARSSLLRRPTPGARPARRTSSVVAALAALAPRLVRVAHHDYPDGLLAMARIIVSGARPTGRQHLGNYHGALKNWLRLQDEQRCFFFVADWHALTTDWAAPEALEENTVEMVLDWLAVGLDPARATLFQQSAVKEHAELYLLLGMLTPVPWLERNPTYKEQRAELQDRDLSTYGFLGYPVLQTADVLMYKAWGVPVGIDQAPHIELAREIARRFNATYGDVFPEPQTLLTDTPRIAGTDGRKMSKSYGNAVYLTDPAKEVEAKLSRMITDPRRARRTDPGDPNDCPAFQSFHRHYCTPEELRYQEEGCRTAGIGCLECK